MTTDFGTSYLYLLLNIDDFNYEDTSFPFLMEPKSTFLFNNRRYKVMEWEIINEQMRQDYEEYEDIFIKVICRQLNEKIDEVSILRELKLNNIFSNE